MVFAFGYKTRSAYLALLMATTAMSLGAPGGAAYAQGLEVASYAVPPSALGRALAAFGAQSGLQLSYLAALTQGKTSPGFSGTASADEALAAILEGSGLSYSFLDEGTVSIVPVAAQADLSALPIEGAILLEPLSIYGARNATTLGETASSVGIVTAEAIDQSRLTYFRDSFRRLGNVMDSAFVSSGFVIRGMSSEGFVPGGSALGTLYVDGVEQTRVSARRGARALWDVEQVEIYRGPQSTLSGRAVTTGAIYIKTADPIYDYTGELSTTVGTGGLFNTSIMANLPIVDNQVAARFSASFERSTSPLDYPTYQGFENLDELSTDSSFSARGKLLVEPDAWPDTRILLSYAFSKDNPTDRMVGAGAGFTFEDNRGDFYQFPTYAEYRPIAVNNVGLEITHDLTEALRLTSLTGLHNGHTKRISVDLGTPGVINGIDGFIDDTLLTQEVRLNYDEGQWAWVAGVYGSYQVIDSKVYGVIAPAHQMETSNRKSTNLAAFGEATYEFMPSWKVTLGGRLDHLRERTTTSSARTLMVLPFAPTTYSAEVSEFNFVPKVGLSYDIDDDQTVGVVYSQGFRSGGYYINYRTNSPTTYGPEQAHNTELFYKGSFLDGQMRLNANLFYTRYKDQQVEIRPDPADPAYRETSNAASSTAWGFEIEPSWQVNDAFSTFVSIGYLNTRFDTFNHASYGDLAGQPFPEAPNWTVGLGARYEFENGFYVGGDAKYTSSYLASFGIAPQDEISERVIVNAQAGYKQENWELNVFAENLFDTHYYTGMDRQAVPAYAQVGKERTLGLNLKAKF